MHARAFAPPAAAARFEFSVTAEPIEIVAAYYRERWPSHDRGTWTIAQGPAAEAFDSAAMFDRGRLARLYGGRHPRLARGPIVVEGSDFVVLLMSPYPEADLTGLNQGTLVMIVRSEVPGPWYRVLGPGSRVPGRGSARGCVLDRGR